MKEKKRKEKNKQMNKPVAISEVVVCCDKIDRRCTGSPTAHGCARRLLGEILDKEEVQFILSYLNR